MGDWVGKEMEDDTPKSQVLFKKFVNLQADFL